VTEAGDVEFRPTPEQERVLAANPELQAELEYLGAVNVTGMGLGPTTYLVPAKHAEYVAARFAPQATSAGEPEARSGRSAKRNKAGKSYDAALAIAVIRRVLEAPVPSRQLRDLLHAEHAEISTTLIDHILDQTRDRRVKGEPYRRLSTSRRKQWERAIGQLADNGTATLDELAELLK
jgi:hypothetical protein